MTVEDPSLVVSVNRDIIIFMGTPEDFYIRTTNPEHKELVRYYMEHKVEVPIMYGAVSWNYTTGKSSLMSILASMIAVDSSVAIIREAPEEIWVELEEQFD